MFLKPWSSVENTFFFGDVTPMKAGICVTVGLLSTISVLATNLGRFPIFPRLRLQTPTF